MRLLLAEDEKELSNALVRILKHSNYSVDAVYNGLDALDYIQAENYDGVILDIMMPGMDGITVLRSAREQGIDTPVLLLTAKSEIDDRVEGLDSGADDYLTKPFAAKELLARLRAMTRRRADTNMTDNVLSLGNIRLNRSNFELTGPKQSFRLANKEFQMLEMLMVSPGRIISADTFFERIWGYEAETEINTVWVYISYLRKKLTAVGADVAINVCRGVGYLIE